MALRARLVSGSQGWEEEVVKMDHGTADMGDDGGHRRQDMELVTFSNPNAATTRNVLFYAKREFPGLLRVFFLDVPTAEGQVFDDTARRTAAERYIDSHVEISAKRVPPEEMGVLIPQLLAERVRANGGRERLIVDLTNGTKNMSCLLYAAASLIRIPNLFFLLVNRASQGASVLPSDIPDGHVKVELLDPMKNTRTIGKAGLFDICYYKDQFETCLGQFKQQKLRNSFLRGQLGSTILSAVDHYFDVRYPECVSLLGALSEAPLCDNMSETLSPSDITVEWRGWGGSNHGTCERS